MKRQQPQQRPIRINKFISDAGIASRRAADELIAEGKVKVNGQVITEPGIKVSGKDLVTVNGKKIEPERKRYAIFYKPAGYITTRNDPNGRKTIYDILPPDMATLKPAGRLDKDSTGLIILTNDGELIMALTHPKAHVPKAYSVAVKGRVSREDVMKMLKGIEIEPGQIAYAECNVTSYEQGKSTLEVVLYQGYNRQIRKMMDILEHPVISLKRIRQASVNISGLERGEYRFLKPLEVKELYNYIKKLQKKQKKNQPSSATDGKTK